MILSVCDMPEVLRVMRIVNIVIKIIRIIVPILLMVSAMIDLVRAVTNSELNKITKPMVAKVVAAVLIFFIPVFVRMIAIIADNDREYEKCLADITSEDIQKAYTNQAEALVERAEKSKLLSDYNNAIVYINNIKDADQKSDYQKRLEEVKKEIDAQKKPVGPGTPTGPVQDTGVLKIYYFGIGRYDGHLIIGNNTVLWIDGGYESQAKKVIPFIKSLGITRIDGLIGSHMHDNHIKAHIEFINQFDIGGVYYAEDPGQCLSKKTCVKRSSDPTKLMALVKEKNIPMTILGRGYNTNIGGLSWDIVAPNGFTTGGSYPENNNSLNMILKFGNHKFYFSGDHVRSNEILQSYDASTLDVDIFKWPHHGQESVSNKFLDVLTPKYIIVPNSSIGSQAQSGISHTKATGYATGSDGYILAESDGTTLTVTRVNKR